MIRNKRPSTWSRTLALVPPVVTLTAQSAHGAFDMFIKIGDIKGEIQEKSHFEWSLVTNFKFGVATEGSKAVARPLVITKPLDRASPQLFLKTAQGNSLQSVTLELAQRTTEGSLVFYQIILYEVTISSVITAGSGTDDRPSEEVSFNFLKIDIQYSMADEKGGVTPTEPVSWDFSASPK